MSFGRKLYLSLLLAAVLPVLIAGTFAFYNMSQTVTRIQDEQLSREVFNFGQNISSLLASLEDGVISRAASPLLKDFTASNGENHKSEVLEILDFWIAGQHSGAFIMNADGVVIASTFDAHEGRSYKNADLFRKASNGLYTQSSGAPVIDEYLSGSFVFSTEIDGSGVLALVLSPAMFERTVEGFKLPDSAIMYLIDLNDNFVFHFPGRMAGQLMPANEIEQLKNEAGKYTAPGTRVYSYVNLNTDRTSFFTRLPQGYVVGMRMDDSVLYASSRTLMIWSGAGAAVVLSAVMIIMWFISVRMAAPLKAAQAAFRAAGVNGVFSQVPVRGSREIADITNSFNALIKLVNEKQNAMEKAYSDVKHTEDTLRRHNNMLKLERDRSNFLINRDPISGVYSRVYFERVATDALKSGQPGAVIFIDIDGFKNINDAFSHEFGDNCLARLGSVLSSPEFEHDVVARIGGDEFMILKYGLKDEIEETATHIYNRLQKPFLIQNVSVLLTGSIGIAMFPQDGTTVAALLKNADLAMFRAKTWGKNQFCFYDSSMTKELQTHMDILDMLRVAHLNGDAYLAYQPQTSLSTGHTTAFEALCRAKSNKLGFVSPADFIPLAESSGLIVPLGEWILKNACTFAKSLSDSGVDFAYMSVNVSLVQLQQENFVDYIFETLEEVGLPPGRLQIEITESVLATSTSLVIKKLKKLKSRGVLIALDDFGTGYSSLNYLIKLPIDTIKIDKSFIDNICNDSNTQIMCRTIIDLGHKLKYKIVAEGTETEEQVKLLTEMGCDLVQGYYYSRPIEASEVPAYIKKRRE